VSANEAQWQGLDIQNLGASSDFGCSRVSGLWSMAAKRKPCPAESLKLSREPWDRVTSPATRESVPATRTLLQGITVVPRSSAASQCPVLLVPAFEFTEPCWDHADTSSHQFWILFSASL
jgi:hypothetical protein